MSTPRMIAWDDGALARGHAAALEILDRIGVEVRDETGLALFEKAGARVEHNRVRVPAELVEQALATAPREFILKGRDGEGAFDLTVKDGPSYFGSGSDCLYVLDPHTGERRRGTRADVEAGAALSEHLPNIDFVMSNWLPEDAPQEVVELVQLEAMLTYSRKPIVVSSARGGDAMREQVEMAEACGGAGSLACLNMSSPSLVLDATCIEKTTSCAELGVPMILETGISIGTSGPASPQTCAVVGHAEVLAVLVLHQFLNPEAPFLYAAGISQLDMRSTVDLYCAPEGWRGSMLQLHLAKSLSLPTFDYAGFTDSKCHDEQWSAELMTSTVFGALAGGTLLHDVGYLESGLLCTFESLVMGDDLAGYARAITTETPVDDTTLLIDEVEAIGPGGSHLGRPLTRTQCRELYRSQLFDGSNYSQWQAGGAQTLGDRVRARTAELLAANREPVVGAQAVADLAALVGKARGRMTAGA
ncbi:MAG TPA: trimethylamine methyltransferase family protein [Thermoleophilia bacterium]|nr:trimethylamine methyltransferase family protein [Thermoleophilia bacterium]